MDHDLHFIIRSSSSDSLYKVTVKGRGARFFISCTCDAGQNGTACKHRLRLLSGLSTDVVDPVRGDIDQIKDRLIGSDIGQRLYDVQKAEEALSIAKRKLAQAKKNLGVALFGAG